MKITIEFYIFKLIQINPDQVLASTNNLDFWNKFPKKFTSGRKHKKMNMRLRCFEPNFPKRVAIFNLKHIK